MEGLSLVATVFESVALMALVAAAAELLAAEEAQDEVEEQPGTADELVATTNQVQAVQVRSAADYPAPGV